MTHLHIPNFKPTINTIKYLLKFVWDESPGKKYIIVRGFLTLICSLFPVIYTILPGLIIDEVTNRTITPTLLAYICLLIISPIINAIISSLTNNYLASLALDLRLKLEEKYYNHILDMDYESLENPDLQILKGRAGETMGEALAVVEKIFTLLSSAAIFISMSTLLFSINPILIVAILTVIFVNSKVTKWLNIQNNQCRIEFSKLSRYEWGYSYMLDNFHYAKEVRMFGLKDFLLNKLFLVKSQEKSIHLKKQKNNSIAELIFAFTNLLQDVVVYVYILYRVVIEGILPGTMTILIASINKFKTSLTSVANSILSLSDSSLKIQELIDFLSIPLVQYNTGDKIPVFDSNSTIEFRNVSFKYPGASSYAIKDLSVTIHGNEKLCIVGENGAGKSTFIKLLVRLYFPTEGEILLNGININEYNYAKYQNLFSPVFQDYCKYYLDLKENIVLSNSYDNNKLRAVVENSGLLYLVKKLPNGYNTQVDKWIDEEGFEPSGGEGQRIAIARACYHGGYIFLLDEPTAALDPNAEYEIYTQFNDIITDKCAVLITHRLSAVQLADKVAVFNDGQVAEYGTHAELYAKGGIYTEMFDKQAQFYRNEAPATENAQEQ